MTHDAPARTCTIRPVDARDAASIVSVLNPIIAAGVYTAIDREISVDEQAAFINAFPSTGVFNVAACERTDRVLALQDVQPVDAADDTPRVGEISTFVALDHRRRGIGRSLTAATVAEATRKGYRRLVATIRADNAQAIAFYRREGFRDVGAPRAAGRPASCADDRVVIVRTLGLP